MRPRPVVIASVAILVAVGVVAGLVVGAWLGGVAAREAPAEGSVDVGFARDMQAHHDQAVHMATLVRARADGAEIGSVALDIALTQQHQSGQMHAWLEQWGLPQRSSGPVMAWMGGHDHGKAAAAGQLMPGMATRAELSALGDAKGVDAERLFLKLMIEHHEAGIEMAAYAANHAGEQAVRRLAHSMATAQEAETRLLRDLLAKRHP